MNCVKNVVHDQVIELQKCKNINWDWDLSHCTIIAMVLKGDEEI